MKSEVFDRKEQRLPSTAQTTFGWDPFEVWRTRVKAASEEAVPLSSALLLRQQHRVNAHSVRQFLTRVLCALRMLCDVEKRNQEVSILGDVRDGVHRDADIGRSEAGGVVDFVTP